jgi:hypothetical protein
MRNHHDYRRLEWVWRWLELGFWHDPTQDGAEVVNMVLDRGPCRASSSDWAGRPTDAAGRSRRIAKRGLVVARERRIK